MTNKIKESNITDGAVTSDKIAPGTIASDRIAPGTIAADRLAGSIPNSKLSNQAITINGTSINLGASGEIVAGTDWQAPIVADGSTTITMVSGRGYFVNVSSNAQTMILPASPSQGDFVQIIDLTGDASTNNITIDRNGSNIRGAAENRTMNSEHQSDFLVYSDASNGWLVEASSAVEPTYTAATGGTETTSGDHKIHTFTSSSNFVVSSVGNAGGSGDKVSYLVIAGGGGGGEGAGGAGGYREGKVSPKDAYSASPLDAGDGLQVSVQTYPITVGAGGNGQTHTLGGLKGSSSTFSTITSGGGGGGGPAPNPVAMGGSGGGREPGTPVSCQPGNHPPVSPPQGNPGGQQSGTRHGGGGGAGSAGGHNAAGTGVSSSISGSAVSRAGGGIGGHQNNPGTPTSPVDGGGNINTPGSSGGAATANTGGGGSGGWTAGGNGGSGLVVIRYKVQN
jgi:hypothetical protein